MLSVLVVFIIHGFILSVNNFLKKKFDREENNAKHGVRYNSQLRGARQYKTVKW